MEQLSRVEMRAAKLYATCLEHGIVPEEYRPGKIGPHLRDAIERDDQYRGSPAASMFDVVAPESGLHIGSVPKPLPATRAHGLSHFIWTMVATKRLPEFYPDHFRDLEPQEIDIPPDPSEEFLHFYVSLRARVQADACVLLAGFCQLPKTDDGDAEEYKPASYFPKSMGSRLRHATRAGRISKPVRSKIENETKLYNVQDARKWWPLDVPKA